MLKINPQSNPNYLAKLVQLKNVAKHPNADKLQTVIIDFQTVVTGMDAKDGDLYIYFPLECQINPNFLAETNSYRRAELNKDKEQAGFFEDKGRVRAVKLRGVPSMGYMVPAQLVADFCKTSFTSDDIDKEFDTVNEILMLQKYIVPVKVNLSTLRSSKKPKVSRLIDGQVKLHVDTEQLRKNLFKFNLNDEISVTYKMHGSSGWCANVQVKSKLKMYEKLFEKLGMNIVDTEYDIVYGSRKVVKNGDEKETKNHFYGYDLWGEVVEGIKDRIPKGYTLYYEIVGFTKDGGAIQTGYDYGCKDKEHEVYIYRITFTNADGISNELSTTQIHEFCSHYNFKTVPLLFKGTVQELILGQEDSYRDHMLQLLETKYTEKRCYMCANNVPEEGCVVRRESMFYFEAYKLKSFAFLEQESKALDEETVDLEGTN